MSGVGVSQVLGVFPGLFALPPPLGWSFSSRPGEVKLHRSFRAGEGG